MGRRRAEDTASPGLPALGPLAGFTVAVLTHRRRHQLADTLEGLGARTVSAQAFRVVPQPDTAAIEQITRECAFAPIDEVLVCSAYGFGVWLDAARRWGLADELVARFAEARLLARDARAADSLRDVGLREIWSTAAATSEELLRYLLAQPPHGQRVVVQIDLPSLREACRMLHREGLDVLEVPTYQTLSANAVEPLRRVVDLAIRGQLDALVFTDAMAVEQVLHQAHNRDRTEAFVAALRGWLPVICLGDLAAAPLTQHGVTPVLPELPFSEELVASVLDVVPQLRCIRLATGRHDVEVRGHAVVLDGAMYPLQSGPIDVLRALASHPGRLLSCADIRQAVPGWAEVDDHAIEMAVFRLRRSLGEVELVQTVIKRGYRLAIEA